METIFEFDYWNEMLVGSLSYVVNLRASGKPKEEKQLTHAVLHSFHPIVAF